MTLHYTIILCVYATVVYWHSKGLDLLTEAAGNLALLNSLTMIALQRWQPGTHTAHGERKTAKLNNTHH
jgi:hypothetical protein